MILMSKIMKKFLIGLSIILLLNSILFIYVNSNFIERYVLYQEKQDMNRVFEIISTSEKPLSEAIIDINNTEDVVVVLVEDSTDNILLNDRLKSSFLEKRISLEKYWLWDQDQASITKNGGKMKVYHQEKLNYSLLVDYFVLEDNFIAVVKIIPSMSHTLDLVNKVSVLISLGSGVVLLLLISALVQKITSPLKKIGDTAKSISKLDFKTVDIHTNDELEILANDINHMSTELKDAHLELIKKNQNMKDLLSNVSHDLKTPVSLIKAYTSGIQDGIDDGTFLETILQQTNQMEDIIEGLLDLAKVQQQDTTLQVFDLSEYLLTLIEQSKVQANISNLKIISNIEPSIHVEGNKQAFYLILSNLLSNALKYGTGNNITVDLSRHNDQILFKIDNEIEPNNSIDLDKLWEPFYVAEESRNKDITGTGLGLSIVKSAADAQGYECKCSIVDNHIEFIVIF